MNFLSQFIRRKLFKKGPARLFIVEFDLPYLSGHYYNQILGFRSAAECRGIKPFIFLHKDVDNAIAISLNALQILDWRPGDHKISPFGFDVFPESDKSLQTLWEAIETGGATSRDIVLILSAIPEVIYSLGRWIGRISSKKSPSVFIRIVGANNWLNLDTLQPNEQAWKFRFAAQDLSTRSGQGRVFFMANNLQSAKALAHLGERRVFFMPIPKFIQSLSQNDSRKKEGPVVYFHLNVRCQQVIEHMDRIIDMIANQRCDVTIQIKLCKNVYSLAQSKSLEKIFTKKGIKLIPTEQTHANYLNTIKESDIVVLPYDQAEYTHHNSGVFVEAVSFGKIIICPENTWMGSQVVEGVAVGVQFQQPDSQGVAQAVLQALEQMSGLLDQAAEKSAIYREKNSCDENLRLMVKFSQSDYDMHVRYSLGETVHFNNTLESMDFLLDGWGATENDGVWTTSMLAHWSIFFDVIPQGPLSLKCRVTPFLGESASQVITVLLGDEVADVWSFLQTSETYPCWVSCILPEKSVASGQLSISFKVTEPTSPKQLGMSEDQRTLGIFFHEMIITALYEGCNSEMERGLRR